MPRILTVPDLQEHVESSVDETALQRLLDDADQAVVSRYGSHGSATDTVEEDVETRRELRIFLSRPASSIVTVVEYTSATLSRTLASTDYRLEFGGQALQRLSTGGTPSLSWGWRAVITMYLDQADNVRRRRVVIDLVRLAIQHTGLAAERAGDYNMTAAQYQSERDRILSELGGGRLVL